MQFLQLGPRHVKNQQHIITAALFDVDNTMIGNELPDLPSPRFKKAVDSARGTIKVGLASARPLAKVAHIIDYIGAEGLSILSNGAQILNNEDKSIVAEWPISLQTCEEVLEYIKSLHITYWINDDGVDYFVNKTDETVYEKQTDIWNHESARVIVPNFQLSKPFVIVLHNITESHIQNIEGFVRAHPDAEVTTLVAHETEQTDGTYLYDVFIVHTHANKKDALHEVARLQHISLEQILAVGDGRNDAVLVANAGIGVAMGNSAKETLAVATYIAPKRDEDGAAIALEYAVKHLT